MKEKLKIEVMCKIESCEPPRIPVSQSPLAAWQLALVLIRHQARERRFNFETEGLDSWCLQLHLETGINAAALFNFATEIILPEVANSLNPRIEIPYYPAATREYIDGQMALKILAAELPSDVKKDPEGFKKIVGEKIQYHSAHSNDISDIISLYQDHVIPEKMRQLDAQSTTPSS